MEKKEEIPENVAIQYIKNDVKIAAAKENIQKITDDFRDKIKPFSDDIKRLQAENKKIKEKIVNEK